MKKVLLGTTFFMLAVVLGCGVSNGPSLIFGSTDSGSTSPFVNLVNGQAADVVLGQADFTTATSYGATQTELSGFYWSGMTLTPTGGILVYDAENNRIMGWNSVPTNPYPNPADFLVGQSSWTATSSGTAAKFAEPVSGAYDAITGKFVVAEYGNTRVLIYNSIPSSSSPGAPFITSNPSVVLGAASVNAHGSVVCDASHVNSVTEVVVTPNGKLLTLDNDKNRVLIYNSIPTTDNQPADMVLGHPTLTACPITAVTNANMDAPNGLWSDGNKIIVSDTDHHRIMIWNSWPTVSGQAADLVLGQPDLTSDAQNNTPGAVGTVSEYGLEQPWGVDSNGEQIFVADTGNNRILVWNSWPTTNQQAPDVVIGQANFTTGSYSGISATSVRAPYGVKSSPGKLFVNDGEKGRILIFHSH